VRYLLRDAEGVIQFDPYFEYIGTIADRLPHHVHEFASKWDHYNLENHSSLHDAWLETVEITETTQDEARATQINLRLLGPYHDRRILLFYKDVMTYSINLSREKNWDVPARRGWFGDLLMHEVRLSETGLVLHELQFERGLLEIECADFTHEEVVEVVGPGAPPHNA
jgi:hypothetical protein